MPIQSSNTITPREQYLMDKERENLLTQLDHQKAMKTLELESSKVSSKWTVLFRLPLALIKLPIQLFVVVAVIVYAIRGMEPPEALTSFLRS